MLRKAKEKREVRGSALTPDSQSATSRDSRHWRGACSSYVMPEAEEGSAFHVGEGWEMAMVRKGISP